ncbi:hypothetical protein [Micromonospora sp. DT62]|uniref:hypothetical protein n=1 Tax=Micromonospora sp. DT62 TaxID=3416521 RepID=UPI003CF205BA
MQRLSLFNDHLPGDPTVFEGGSTVRGWANKHSDRDWYAILPTVHEPHAPDVRRVPCGEAPGWAYRLPVVTADGVVDTQIWSATQVECLVAAMALERLHGGVAAGELSNAEVDFLGRLWHGRAISGEPEVASWQRRLRESAARQIMAARCLRLADNAIDDAVGQWEADDIRSATLAASRAYGFAVDAVLATAGEFSFSSKWRVRRIEHVRPSQFTVDDYWAVETMRDYHDDPQAWVERVLITCQTIAASIEL